MKIENDLLAILNSQAGRHCKAPEANLHKFKTGV